MTKQAGQNTGISRTPVFIGLVQDWQSQMDGIATDPAVLSIQAEFSLAKSARHYLMFDSHYYLADYKITKEGQVYVAGGDFPSYPGTYFLPHM